MCNESPIFMIGVFSSLEFLKHYLYYVKENEHEQRNKSSRRCNNRKNKDGNEQQGTVYHCDSDAVCNLICTDVFEFPIPIMPAFIKFDFSDLPALIGTFAYGRFAA